MKKLLLLVLIIAVLLPAGALAQDMPHAGAEVVTTFMQSGTYDIGAEQLEPGFEELTGIELEIVASPLRCAGSESHHRSEHGHGRI